MDDKGAHAEMNEGRKLHEASIAGRGVDPAGAFSMDEPYSPDGVAVVMLRGELDMAAAPELRRRVDAAAGRPGLVVDLSQTTFVDSAVLKELLRAGPELARHDTRLVLVAVAPPVKRLLDLTRTGDLFTLAADRREALRLIAGADGDGRAAR